MYELQARVHHLRTRSSLYEDELTEAYELLELLRTALHDVSSSHEAAVVAAVADTKEAVVLAQVLTWLYWYKSTCLLLQKYKYRHLRSCHRRASRWKRKVRYWLSIRKFTQLY